MLSPCPRPTHQDVRACAPLDVHSAASASKPLNSDISGGGSNTNINANNATSNNKRARAFRRQGHGAAREQHVLVSAARREGCICCWASAQGARVGAPHERVPLRRRHGSRRPREVAHSPLLQPRFRCFFCCFHTSIAPRRHNYAFFYLCECLFRFCLFISKG
jgi:hypothetical protein